MGLFKSAAEKELDYAIMQLDMNLSHNYIKNAEENLQSFEERFDDLCKDGVLKNSTMIKYADLIDVYRTKIESLGRSKQIGRWR